MIIIKLKGGLGNQLFQYALGRNISISRNINVAFDLSWFKERKDRTYKLKNFNVKENIISEKEAKKLRKYSKKLGKLSFFHNLFIADHSKYIYEKQFSFDPDILKVKDNVYLNGSWQSEKYFKDIKNILKKEIILSDNTSSEYQNIEKQMQNTNSVSLHIRQGDYTSEKVQKVLKLLSNSYYQDAIRKIKSLVQNPTFFIFSDDVEWAKNNIKIDSPVVFVSDGSLEDYEELMLMSKCKHNIIANSTFSWWGAWLNNSINKKVMAPKKWFNNETKDTSDLIPDSWIRI